MAESGDTGVYLLRLHDLRAQRILDAACDAVFVSVQFGRRVGADAMSARGTQFLPTLRQHQHLVGGQVEDEKDYYVKFKFEIAI